MKKEKERKKEQWDVVDDNESKKRKERKDKCVHIGEPKNREKSSFKTRHKTKKNKNKSFAFSVFISSIIISTNKTISGLFAK